MTKRPKIRKLPRFRSEEAERKFWATHDSTDYFDYANARHVIFPRLRPSTATISLLYRKGCSMIFGCSRINATFRISRSSRSICRSVRLMSGLGNHGRGASAHTPDIHSPHLGT